MFCSYFSFPMSAFTTRMLPWCYPQEELPTTAATDAPQLLISGLLQLPTATSSSSVGLKIYKMCVSFLNNVPLFRHTETISAELSQSWKWVTHPLLGSSPPRTAGSRANPATEQEQVTGLMQRGDVKGGQGSFGHTAWHCLTSQEICSKLPSLYFTVSCLGQRSFEVYQNYSGSFLFAHYEHVPVGVKTDE